ncbi:MAG: hypothetical protein CL569_09195 [Alphaproteobacteria bacterium]|nr:hypothetical protein [Alphaproteobacteria bacterium]|tara:strand:- start:124 stop:1077 length:954 start_codon:yes stop_codon:yes gene_type:complete
MANTAVSAPDFREERDRFVAFALASAEAFLELDEEFNVDYAVGAVQWLSGTSHDLIIGKPLIEFVYQADRPMVRAALGGVKRQGRFGPINVCFSRGDETPIKTAMFGSYLPTHEGRIYLALSAQRMAAGATEDDSAIDEETGFLTKESFSDMAAEALKAGKEQGRDYNMTLLHLDGLEKVKAKLGDEEAEDFIATITAELQANSVNGSSAGHLDGDKFGLVHDSDVNIAAGGREMVTHALALQTMMPLDVVKRIMAPGNGKSITALNWKAGLSMRTAVKLQRPICAVSQKNLPLARDGIGYPMTEGGMGWYLDFFDD